MPSPASMRESALLPVAVRNTLAELLGVQLEDGRREPVRLACDLLAGAGRTTSAPRHPQDAALARHALRGAGFLADADGVEAWVEPPWAAAARHRLAAYATALEGAPRGTSGAARLAQARALLAELLYFEVHEVLEPAWRSSSGADKVVLQGAIQAAVAWHHWQRGNRSAAQRLAEEAARKLHGAATAPPPIGEIAGCIVPWARWLRAGAVGDAPPLPYRRGATLER